MSDDEPPPSSKGITASKNPALLQQRIQTLEAELRDAKVLMTGLAGLAGSTRGRTVKLCKSEEEVRSGQLDDAIIPSSIPASSKREPSPANTSICSYESISKDPSDPSLHLLLILSDSALPLGSFAFSSGLESYLTHLTSSSTSKPPPPPQSAPLPTVLLRRFLNLSLTSLATTTLPFITAAYRIPLSQNQTTQSATAQILQLSDTFDATTICPVLRRASSTQGKALLSVWEKSLKQTSSTTVTSTSPPPTTPNIDLPALISSYRHSPHDSPPHLPIAWSLVSLSSRLSLYQTLFVFLINHTKALLSAAVRLNLIGPYVAQRILASPETLDLVKKAQEVGMSCKVDEAGQTVPTLDLYGGRHELLYSRVFNS